MIGSVFQIQNNILNFYDWNLCYHEPFHDKKKKSMNSWHSNNMKVVLSNFAKHHCFWTLWTLNYVHCIFLVSILSIWHTIKPNNLRMFKSLFYFYLYSFYYDNKPNIQYSRPWGSLYSMKILQLNSKYQQDFLEYFYFVFLTRFDRKCFIHLRTLKILQLK